MEFNKKGKILLFVGVVGILLSSFLFYYLVMNKDYERVFIEQSPEQLSKIATSLEDAGLKFKYPESGNGLLIEKSRLSQARIQLSKDNVFKSEVAGLEIFGEAQHAMSDFYQKINYQRAIQGELEKSILTITGVKSARVHLAIPREKSFSRKETDVKAAVTLTVSEEDNPNVRAIVSTVKQLVSSAVIDLKPENVSVLNSSGQLLAGGTDLGLATNDAFGLKHDIERSIESKVQQLLSAYFDVADIGISSWATVNNDKVSETTEGLDSSEDPVVLKRVTETTLATKKAPKSTTLNEEFSYKSVKRAVDYQKGKLERLTVSVMVPETDHFTSEVLYELIANALGIDESRGDKLSVVLVPVHVEKDLPQYETTLSELEITGEVISVSESVEANSTLLQDVVSASQVSKETLLWILAILILSLVCSAQYYQRYRQSRLSQKEEEMIVQDVQLWLEGRSFEQDVKL